jgi:lipopolysaccharide transport system permease protein
VSVPLEPQPTVVALIVPRARRVELDLHALWEYRQLVFFLTWRDVKVRYKQTVLGASWAILQPLLATVVFTIFLQHVGHVSSEGLPYPLFSFVGLLGWTYFANGLTNASNSLVLSASMITKVYFPRLALPIAAVAGGLVDFLCAVVVLVPLMAYYRVVPSVRLALLPAFLVLATFVALGAGFALSAASVRFRDVRYVVPFAVQLWMWSTPVVYSAHLLHQPWRTLYGLNPMVSVVEGFRWAVLSSGSLDAGMLAVSGATALLLLAAATLYFRRIEDTFADVI